MGQRAIHDETNTKKVVISDGKMSDNKIRLAIKKIENMAAEEINVLRVNLSLTVLDAKIENRFNAAIAKREKKDFVVSPVVVHSSALDFFSND